MATNNNNDNRTLVFVYGTLKKGFPNHVYIEKRLNSGEAEFLGTGSTTQPYPMLVGPYNIPFLLSFPGSGHQVRGELYAISPAALELVDKMEGVGHGHYERLPVVVSLEGKRVEAYSYFGHRSYAEEMWKSGGGRGREWLEEYVLEMAKGYDAPSDDQLVGNDICWIDGVQVDDCFIEGIRKFIASPNPN